MSNARRVTISRKTYLNWYFYGHGIGIKLEPGEKIVAFLSPLDDRKNMGALISKVGA